jgi:DNA-binding protein HU-beta
MNKSELIDHISQEHGCTKADAERAVNMFTSSITSSLKKGEEIALVGFGTFYTSKAAAREGRNPKTGAALKIAARIQPKFRAGKTLKDACNNKK